jgi:hypothetical protein
VLWDISYANLNMLLATIPSSDFDDENKKEKNVEQVDGIDELSDFLGL